MVKHKKSKGVAKTSVSKGAPKKSSKRRFYKRKTFWLVLFMFFASAGLVAYLYTEQYTRPYRERALTYDLEKINELEIPSRILDRNGKEIGRIFVQNRSVMSIKDVPELFRNALKAGEDSRYEMHHGVDYIGIVRALKLNYQAGTTTQGASTITQQLARNAYPLKQDALTKGESGIQRKMVEAFLAMRIEKRYTKDEILEFYLNRIYFGSGFYGLRSASLGYFGKEPKDLNLVECATIVGLIKNPTNNSPLNNLQASKVARNMVLKRMWEEKMLTQQDYDQAQLESLALNPKPLQRGTSHLYERIADAVGAALGRDALSAGGFTIHTTILAEAQSAAEKSLRESLNKAEKHPDYTAQKRSEYSKNQTEIAPEYVQGAVFMIDHNTGEVLVHVGGRDYAQVPYDFIEQGQRPLGTAFYPFLYSVGLADKHTPVSILEDEPMDNRAVMVSGREGILGEWGMEVNAPIYEGRITLRKAFEHAKIAATVRLGYEIGIERIITAGKIFGFPLQNTEVLPRVMVGWEAASLKQAVSAISTFPLGGKKGATVYTYIKRVENDAGNVVYEKKILTNPSGRLLDEKVAWQMHDMMSAGMERGSARGLKNQLTTKPFDGGGKGGTTHDFSDAWFLGYNGRVSCGVWTGFLQGNSTPIYPGAFSRDLAMPIWVAAMNEASASLSSPSILRPVGIVDVKICSVSGQRVTEYCQELQEDVNTGKAESVSTEMTEHMLEGTQGLPFCAIHSGGNSIHIDSFQELSKLPAIDTIPIRPLQVVLNGEDPYHTEIPGEVATNTGTGLMNRSTNVLDSFDLTETEETIRLLKPPRLEISPD
ncbi:MAG: transglycosylase domain-containing protein [Akkermansiaceae bacterium]